MATFVCPLLLLIQMLFSILADLQQLTLVIVLKVERTLIRVHCVCIW